MKIQHKDQFEVLVSPQTALAIRTTPDDQLFEQEANLRFHLQQQASIIEQLASDVAGVSFEHLDLQTKKATRELSEREADEMISANRAQFSELQNKLIAEQNSTRNLEASLQEMSREVKQRRSKILADEKAKLAAYANALFVTYEKQVAESMRQLVIFASWKTGLPLLGETSVQPDRVLQSAMKHCNPSDHTFWSLQSIVDSEMELRAKVLGESNESH